MMILTSGDESRQQYHTEKEESGSTTKEVSLPSSSSSALPQQIVFDWWIDHGCVSTNCELAILTNVCRSWRQSIQTSLLSQHKRQQQTQTEQPSPSSHLLLLPTMIRYIQQQQQQGGDNNNDIHSKLLSSSHPLETFCAAWFHPLGIKLVSVPTASLEDIDDDAVVLENPSQSTTATAAKSYLQKQRKQQTQAVPPLRPCAYEWQSYRDAYNILRPFGYAKSFVNSLLQMAVTTTTTINSTKPPHHLENGDDSHHTVPQNNHDGSELDYRRTTPAVRGATYARPESYCMCWDDDDGGEDNDSKIPTTTTLSSSYHPHRLNLQRQLLPRVILSSPSKRGGLPTSTPSTAASPMSRQPTLQFLNASGGNAVRLFTPPFYCGPIQHHMTILIVGIATEDGCFLSGLPKRGKEGAEQQQQARIVHGRSCCEIGHMYPNSARDGMIDQSPICVAMETISVDKQPESTEATTSMAPTQQQGKSLLRALDRKNDGDDLAENLEGNQSTNGYHNNNGTNGNFSDNASACNCPFPKQLLTDDEEDEGDDDNDSSDDDDDDDDGDDSTHNAIVRGQIGPGQWHCYTIVVDGNDPNNTIIRVDGSPERMTRNQRSWAPSPSSPQLQPCPLLDGLTIGSDHCFDMSLCFGDGSDGEGEGAISELVVWQGRLTTPDLECLEHHLMSQHGIPRRIPGTELFCQQGHEWHKQTRAMMMIPPGSMIRAGSPADDENRIPLRVVAQDPSVAWKRTSPVTGQNIAVSRIGSKFSTGSSDW